MKVIGSNGTNSDDLDGWNGCDRGHVMGLYGNRKCFGTADGTIGDEGIQLGLNDFLGCHR